ncbi:MAG: hypothetical protein AAF660_15160 [Pseudomonadota bacterium]
MTQQATQRRRPAITASGLATLLLGLSLITAKAYDLAVDTTDLQTAQRADTLTALASCPISVGAADADSPLICSDSVVTVSTRLKKF